MERVSGVEMFYSSYYVRIIRTGNLLNDQREVAKNALPFFWLVSETSFFSLVFFLHDEDLLEMELSSKICF